MVGGTGFGAPAQSYADGSRHPESCSLFHHQRPRGTTPYALVATTLMPPPPGRRPGTIPFVRVSRLIWGLDTPGSVRTEVGLLRLPAEVCTAAPIPDRSYHTLAPVISARWPRLFGIAGGLPHHHSPRLAPRTMPGQVLVSQHYCGGSTTAACPPNREINFSSAVRSSAFI